MGLTHRGLRAVPAALLGAALLAGCGTAPTGSGSAPQAGATPTTAAQSSRVPNPPTSPWTPGGTPSASPTVKAPSDWPTCDSVWKTGNTVPHHYRGCADEQGMAVKAAVWMCEFAKPMTTYSDRYYGVLGSRVNDAGGPLEHSKKYQHAYALCTG